MQITSKTLKEIGDRLRKIREEKSMPRQDVAQAIGISFNQYSKIERGELLLKLENLIKLSDVLDVSLDVIVFGRSRKKIKLENTSLDEKFDLLRKLPPEDQHIAHEVLGLLLTKQMLKKLSSSFQSVPPHLLKKYKK